MIRMTSKKAYDELKTTGKELTQKERILQLLIEQQRPLSLQEICALTGIQINAVSGRVNTLKKERRVHESTKRPCGVTKKTITPIIVTPF